MLVPVGGPFPSWGLGGLLALAGSPSEHAASCLVCVGFDGDSACGWHAQGGAPWQEAAAQQPPAAALHGLLAR